MIYKAVLFDGPFHGQVWRHTTAWPHSMLVLLEPPKVADWNLDVLDPLGFSHAKHQYLLARTFDHLNAALYKYGGLSP